MKTLWFAAVFFLAQAGGGRAEDAAATNRPAAAKPRPLQPLVNYLLRHGEPATSEAYLNKNLQLGDGDVSVLQKGWRGRDQLSHLAIIPQNDHGAVVILRFDAQVKGVGWRTSPAGQLVQTIEFDRTPHESHAVANEAHAQEFELEKRFLLGKAATASQPAK